MRGEGEEESGWEGSNQNLLKWSRDEGLEDGYGVGICMKSGLLSDIEVLGIWVKKGASTHSKFSKNLQ